MIDLKVLDIGCGQRKYETDNLEDKVIGIDIDKNSKADVIHDLDSFPWPFESNEFDVVYSSHCLEHLNDWIKALEEMIRIVKPDGIIELMVPHFSSVIAYGTVGHKNFFSCSTFTKSLENHIKNLKLENIKLRYLVTSERKISFLEKIFHNIFTTLANLNIHFCERFWCYWVGGFGEIYLKYRVVK